MGLPTAKRPVFSETLGALFTRLRREAPLRAEHNFHTQNAAASNAKSRKIGGISQNILWRLESGLVKQPTPTLLRSIAKLYGYPYDHLAQHVLAVVYQIEHSQPLTKLSDLLGHPLRIDSATQESSDGRANPSTSSEERLRALERGFRDVLAIALNLIGQTAGTGAHDASAIASRSGRTGTESHGPSHGHRRARARVSGESR